MMIRAVLLTGFLLVSVHAADFDQGKIESIGLPLIPRAIAEEPVLVPGVKGLEMATAHARLQTYLSNNSALRETTGLLLDSRMGQLTPELQKRLQAEGAGLTRERDGLLPGAASLDQEDTGLVDRSDELNRNKAGLDTRLSEINRQVAEYEGYCAPTHPPERHAWCVETARRLNAIIGQYNSDVKTHNAAVDRWKQDAASMQPRWDAFVQKILEWEGRVKNLGESIKSAFGQLTDCEYIGGHSEIINVEPLESKITCAYTCCGNHAEHVHFIKGTPTQSQVDFICTNPIPRCIPSPAIHK